MLRPIPELLPEAVINSYTLFDIRYAFHFDSEASCCGIRSSSTSLSGEELWGNF